MKKIGNVSFQLLTKVLTKRAPQYLFLLNDFEKLSENDYNLLREIVCDELIENGYVKNGEINEYGNQLEQLIDDVGHMFM